MVVTSSVDLASVNIMNNLLELISWKREGEFRGKPIFRFDQLTMIINTDHHIESEELDAQIRNSTSIDFSKMIFASRHKAESGTASLTVHPIGNFSEARYGGRESTLVPSMPHEMSGALLNLKKHASDIGCSKDYQICFEATHHGPYLDTPTMFIEIGSGEQQWRDPKAGKAVAKSILDIPHCPDSGEIISGIGGGHYCPRFTDIVKDFNAAFGHMIPNWGLKGADDGAILSALKKTPGATKVYIHRKSMKGKVRRHLEELFNDNGYEIVRSGGLEKR